MTITVSVAGKGSDICTSATCLFSYSKSATPLLTGIGSRSVILGSQSKISGYHRVANPGNSSSTGDISSVKIGSYDCPRGEDGILNKNDVGQISCSIPTHFTAGLYNISERTYWGYADKSSGFSSVSVSSGRRYDIAIHPTVHTISTDVGSTGGSDIRITGTGFDASNISNNIVNAGGVNCNVYAATETTIDCIT